jgi:hypothetical protein
LPARGPARFSSRPCRRIAAGLLAACAASNCASARLTSFHDFSKAGVSYVKAAERVLNDAGTAAIRSDTAVLIAARPVLSEEERRDRIVTANELLRDRLRILEDIRRHGRLLQEYFEALAALADGKTPASASAAAQGAFKALTGLSESIRRAQIGEATIGKLVSIVAEPVVAGFKAGALEHELRQRAGAIANELALQQAALQAIAGMLTVDVQAQMNLEESQEIVAPYARNAALARSWADARERLLETTAALENADAAAHAAGALRQAFVSLVQNRFDTAALQALFDDIDSVVDVAEAVGKGSR